MTEHLDLDLQESCAAFVDLLNGPDRAYFTDKVCEKNASILYSWAIANGFSTTDFATISAWQIAFAQNRSVLVRDEDAPVMQRLRERESESAYDAAFPALVSSLSCAQLKDCIRADKDLNGVPGFRARYDRINGLGANMDKSGGF